MMDLVWKAPLLVRGILGVALLLTVGCGGWPPSVDDACDINRLPSGQEGLCVSGLADDQIHALSRFGKLRELDFGHGSAIHGTVTDAGLEVLAGLDLPELRRVSFFGNQHITDRGLASLLRIGSLRELVFFQCPGITDDGLRELARGGSLILLGLGGCDGVTDQGLGYLHECADLQELSLSGCRNITEDGILHLASLRTLQKLYLTECPRVSQGAVARLREAMPSVRIGYEDGVWSHGEWQNHRKGSAEKGGDTEPHSVLRPGDRLVPGTRPPAPQK